MKTESAIVEKNPLTVAILSLDIARGDVDENLRRVSNMIKEIPPQTDVVLLPELFTTSFLTDTDLMLSMAEPSNGKTVDFLSNMAIDKGIMIAGSFLCREADSKGEIQYYNRGFMVMPDRQCEFYDKHHLFCLSKEAALLRHGEARQPIVKFRGWNITMSICYELRFPVWSRNVDMKADMMLVPANWPINRGYAWRQLLIARAIENQMVVIGADRSGSDDYGSYDGLSLMVDELGRQIVPEPLLKPEGCSLPDSYGVVTETPFGPVLSATFTLDKVKKLRQWMPTVRDADSFELKVSK